MKRTSLCLCRRHYVFGLSVRPSVRSLKYPLSTCTWVRWSIRSTVTVLWHVRPSVRPERFLGICWRTHGGNGLKLCMLMYLHHLQRWLDYGHNLLILMLFWLSETGQIWGFWSISGERMGVNVEGERRHISDALRRVLSSFTNIIIYSQNTLIFLSRKWIWFYSNALSWMKNNVFWFKFPDGASPVRAWRRIGDKLLPGPTTIDG